MFVTLVNQVRAITGSTTGETTDAEVVTFVQHGVRNILSSLPVQLSFPFSTLTAAITTSTPIAISTNKLLTVDRNSIECVQVPESLAYEIGDTNSIHQATSRYPAFYLTGNKIYVKPDPTTGASARATIVDINAKTTAVTTGISSSVGQYDHVVVKYAAYLDANAAAAYLLRQGTTELDDILNSISSKVSLFVSALPTYTSETFTVYTDTITDALDNASDIVNVTAEDYLEAEDPEIVASAIQTARQEVERASTAIQQELMEIKDFDSKVGQKVQQFKLELDAAKAYLDAANIHVATAAVVKTYQDKASVYSQMARELYKECQILINNYSGANRDTSRSDGESRQ